MSGGHLNYFFSSLEDHIGDFGDKELDNLVADLAELFHAREWFLSGDTGAGEWAEARDAFKEKWFTAQGQRERIEKYLVEITDEIRKSFGISRRYCWNCQHWRQDTRETYERYGSCPFHKRVLMHRSECCERFALKEAHDDY